MPGGVCAILDYKIELMADYVSEMATRIVMPQSQVNPAFRKFVSQMLTSTRLPSTTILLGMNYLAKRINMMHAAGQNDHTEGQVWRMLTIALLLGSKFLDDNTFQNKSWSEVSGISVRELNTLEYEWLEATEWCLYVNLDASKDYQAWLENWKEWQEAKERQPLPRRDRLMVPAPLSPIEPDMGRGRTQHLYSTWHQQQVAEYERLSATKRNQRAPAVSFRHDQPLQWSYPPTSWVPSGPLTPPDSGYGTPEYTNSNTSVTGFTDWLDGQSTLSQNCPQIPPHSAWRQLMGDARDTARYGPSYNYATQLWKHPSAVDCSCGLCVGGHHHKPAPYFGNHGYGQPVMG